MLVKICGVTDPEDAFIAAEAGADMVGMILWKGSKRGVSLEKAREIAVASKEAGSVPVAVFVEGTFSDIKDTCDAISVNTVQLHGHAVKRYVPELSKYYSCFLAASVNREGEMDPSEALMLAQLHSSAKFLLFDHDSGGTGQPFCWDRFQPYPDKPWFLAGGIHPYNVSQALSKLKPWGIDVSSGVERKGTHRKDSDLIKHLIEQLEKCQ
jgi:phosphoribosylanthranilate isomerase